MLKAVVNGISPPLTKGVSQLVLEQGIGTGVSVKEIHLFPKSTLWGSTHQVPAVFPRPPLPGQMHLCSFLFTWPTCVLISLLLGGYSGARGITSVHTTALLRNTILLRKKWSYVFSFLIHFSLLTLEILRKVFWFSRKVPPALLKHFSSRKCWLFTRSSPFLQYLFYNTKHNSEASSYCCFTSYLIHILSFTLRW